LNRAAPIKKRPATPGTQKEIVDVRVERELDLANLAADISDDGGDSDADSDLLDAYDHADVKAFFTIDKDDNPEKPPAPKFAALPKLAPPPVKFSDF
jgi:hypothetical protein